MIPIARPILGDKEREAVGRVIASGNLAAGPEVAAFESEFAATAVAGRQCVAVNSGTAALHLGLLAMGIGPGDEVIVPSFTFAASANAVVLAGATPVFVDIEPTTFCLSVSAVSAALSRRTAAVMPVHLFGQPADMTELGKLASSHQLAIIEDAAQAHLATWDGKPVGTFGEIAAFSFYPTKNMTTGEGGMIVCADEAAARKARLLRNQGMATRYLNEIVGFNARMTDLQAAIGRVQLQQLQRWTAQRQANAAFYDGAITRCQLPTVAAGADHVYHQYTLRLDGDARDTVRDKLESAGVSSGVYYPQGVHQLPSFGLDLDLPETQRACREVLSIPVHPSLSDEDLQHVANAVNEAVRAAS